MAKLKLNKYYHHAKFDIDDIYNVQENPYVMGLDTAGQSNLTLIMTYSHFHVSQKYKRKSNSLNQTQQIT